MVTSFVPSGAPVVFRLSVTWVCSGKVPLLTVAPPLTEALMWLGYPGPPLSAPGSKNPDPADEVPVICTLAEGWPPEMWSGEAAVGVAGGGAFSLITRTPHELVALAYSCKVQKVRLSVGWTTVW